MRDIVGSSPIGVMLTKCAILEKRHARMRVVTSSLVMSRFESGLSHCNREKKDKMSNCAFVIPKRNTTFTALDAVVKHTVSTRFPNYKAETCPEESGWLVVHEKETDLSFNIWVERRGRKRVLQIPHKHCYGFMWWVEYEIRERLAASLDAKQYDEGIGDTENCVERYETYADYLKGVYGEKAHLFLEMARDEVAVGLPPDVMLMQGLDCRVA